MIPASSPSRYRQVLRTEQQYFLTADMFYGRTFPHITEMFVSRHFQFTRKSPAMLQIF